jgi:hypothetical protein
MVMPVIVVYYGVKEAVPRDSTSMALSCWHMVGFGVLGMLDKLMMAQLTLQVVPTVYTNIRNETLHTNQFSVTENFRESGDTSGGGRNLPGVFFFYDMSPIKVGKETSRRSAAQGSLVKLCLNGMFLSEL